MTDLISKSHILTKAYISLRDSLAPVPSIECVSLLRSAWI